VLANHWRVLFGIEVTTLDPAMMEADCYDEQSTKAKHSGGLRSSHPVLHLPPL